MQLSAVNMLFFFLYLLAFVFSPISAAPAQGVANSTSARDYVAYPIGARLCKDNPNDFNMCFISYIDWQNWVQPALYFFDHNCVLIGFNPSVPRDVLAGDPGFSMSSELPDCVVIHVGNVWSFPDDINFWYNGNHVFPMTDYANIGAGWTENNVRAIDPSDGSLWLGYRMAFRC